MVAQSALKQVYLSTQVAEVVLVECTDARVCQAATTRLMLSSVSPQARLTVLPAARKSVQAM